MRILITGHLCTVKDSSELHGPRATVRSNAWNLVQPVKNTFILQPVYRIIMVNVKSLCLLSAHSWLSSRVSCKCNNSEMTFSSWLLSYRDTLQHPIIISYPGKNQVMTYVFFLIEYLVSLWNMSNLGSEMSCERCFIVRWFSCQLCTFSS